MQLICLRYLNRTKKTHVNYIWEKFSYLNSLLLSCDICKPFRYSDIVGTKLPHDFYLPFRYPDMFSSGYRTVKLLQTKVWLNSIINEDIEENNEQVQAEHSDNISTDCKQEYE